jgi:hypothetical protein
MIEFGLIVLSKQELSTEAVSKPLDMKPAT